MSTYIDLEIIQSLPFSNANRDDAGQPKTVKVGGATRGRLSSQSLKRAARFYGADKSTGYGLPGDTSGGTFYRTQYILSLILEAVERKGGDEAALNRVTEFFSKDNPLGKHVAKKVGDTLKAQALVVLTKEEVNALADAFIEGEVSAADIEKVLIHSGKRDIALWGRFFASSSKATLDGSAQVAHAFTTHSVNIEDDFFTGMDDARSLFEATPGAGHPGTNFYSNGTFYKYSNINLNETILNLINAHLSSTNDFSYDESITTERLLEMVSFLVEDFITSFSLSVPQGKVRSTAHQTLPYYISVSIRDGRPVNNAIAFEEPVYSNEKNIPRKSVEVLEHYKGMSERIVGKPKSEYVLSYKEGSSNVNSLTELIENLITQLQPEIEKIYEHYRSSKK